MSNYALDCQFIKDKIIESATNIFKVYGNELVLRLEDYNLFSNQHNSIASSTAPGFIIEEFLVSKLEVFTKDNLDFHIKRAMDNTATNHSYDCYCEYNDIFFMINIKIDKGNNNAISAINILQKDYCNNKEQIKAYIVLKISYDYDLSMLKKERCLVIKNLLAFLLEEIDFSAGHKQDHRNWSASFNAKSGRLQVSDAFRKENQIAWKDISYQRTYNFINKMCEN